MEKSKFMMIIIIVLLVVLLGTVVGVSFYVLNMVKNQAAIESAAERDIITKNLSIQDITNVSLGAPITTNLAKSNASDAHVAKIGVGVSYDKTDEKAAAAFAVTLSENLDYAKSKALACIYSSTYEELSAADGPATLAETIKTVLQNEFNTTLIVGVYFEEWILQ